VAHSNWTMVYIIMVHIGKAKKSAPVDIRG